MCHKGTKTWKQNPFLTIRRDKLMMMNVTIPRSISAVQYSYFKCSKIWGLPLKGTVKHFKPTWLLASGWFVFHRMKFNLQEMFQESHSQWMYHTGVAPPSVSIATAFVAFTPSPLSLSGLSSLSVSLPAGWGFSSVCLSPLCEESLLVLSACPPLTSISWEHGRDPPPTTHWGSAWPIRSVSSGFTHNNQTPFWAAVAQEVEQFQ